MKISPLAAMAIACALFVPSAHADRLSKGYVKSNGSYVAPHYQTRANQTKFDNYSTKGNSNPYTGKSGTVDPYKPRASRRKY